LGFAPELVNGPTSKLLVVAGSISLAALYSPMPSLIKVPTSSAGSRSQWLDAHAANPAYLDATGDYHTARL